MIKKILLMTFLILFSISCVFAAQKEKTVFFKGIRPMGMGGAFVAVADDENAFFHNPAGIAQRSGKMLQLFSLDAAVNSDNSDFFDFYSDNRNDLENFDKLAPAEQAALLNRINAEILGIAPKINLGAPNFAFISGPQRSSYQNYFSVGLGFFAFAEASFRFNRSIIIPSLTYKGEVSAVAAVPVAYRISSLSALGLPGKLSLGTNIKYIYKAVSEAGDLSIDEFKSFTVPIQEGRGLGADFGLIYHLNDSWNIGFQITDVFTTKIDYSEYNDDKNPARSKDAFTGEISPELNIGAAYFPEKLYYWPGKYISTGRDVTIAADLTDLTDEDETLSESFWKKVHLGAEIKFMGILAVRGGINSGYPSFGAGIETGLILLDYAFYGEEEGKYAGQDPLWMHRLRFSVRIGKNNAATEASVKTSSETCVKKEKAKKKKADKNKDAGALEPSGTGENQKAGQENARALAEDVQPARIPVDAKDTISKTAEITEEVN